MRAPIHSRKHIRQISLSTALTGTRNSEILISAVAVTAKNTPTEVEEGAIVKAVYIELWTIGSSSNTFEIVCLCKRNNNLGAPTFTEMSALDTFAEKKNVLFTHQGLSSNDGITGPVRVLGGWIKIPKSKQRFGLGDLLSLGISSPSANDVIYCGLAIYKEYT